MKRKILSFIMLFILTFSFASGCSKGTDNGLSIDGKEVIVKVGDEYLTADQLFDEMKVSTDNMKYFYEEIKNIIIRRVSPVDDTMRYSVGEEIEAWEAMIKSKSIQNKTSYNETKKSALEMEGVSSIEELTDKKLFALQKEKTTNKYWKEMEDEYFNTYILEMMPFHVSQIFIATSKANEMDEVMKSIDKETAEKLGEVSKRLIEGEKFYNVAQAFSDDEKSKDNGGDLGLINIKSEVSDEVKFALASYARYILKEDTIIAENDYLTNYYESGVEAIPYTYVKKLNEVFENEEISMKSYNGSSARFYPRSIIFNNLFNTKTFRYLVNDDAQPSAESNFIEMDNIRIPHANETGFFDTASASVILNSSDNPILVVRSNEGVHFLSINKTPYDLDALDYYDKNPSETDDYLSYVELAPTEAIKNERKEDLSTFAYKAATLCMYLQKNEEYINYGMVQKYMEEYVVTVLDQDLAHKFDVFLNGKIDYNKTLTLNNLKDKLNILSINLQISKTDDFQKELAPLICLTDKQQCVHKYGTGVIYTEPEGGEN